MQTIELRLREVGGAWFGLAACDKALVATSVDRSREGALSILERCLPPGSPRTLVEGPSEFADETALMLAAIEAGNEQDKCFELSTEYIPEPAASVFRLAASIPIGYTATYGGLAVAAGTIARAVGRLMARNPLYPIVPCHRVVGADYSLVGYRGMTSGPDLDDKLERLRAEARGYMKDFLLPGGNALKVFPVEWVLAKAAKDRGGETGQILLL